LKKENKSEIENPKSEIKLYHYRTPGVTHSDGQSLRNSYKQLIINNLTLWYGVKGILLSESEFSGFKN